VPTLHLQFEVLKQAIRAVPAVKWALGVAGLVAAVGIVEFLVHGNWIVAIVGTVVMLMLATVLVIFARAAQSSAADLVSPSVVLVWFALLLTCAFSTALFTTVTFGKPVVLAGLLGVGPMPSPKPATVPFNHTYIF
jgi:hypothetical protein